MSMMSRTWFLCRKAGPCHVLGFEMVRRLSRENTMLALAIAMGTVVWAMIGYALLSPAPPAPEGAD
jgi:hypothetical protein